MNILRITLIACCIALIACAGAGKLTKSEQGTREQIREDIAFLAADILEGREVGSAGAEKAAEYIAARMAAINLQPGGTEGYFQEFALSQLDPHNPHSTASVVRGKNVIGYLDRGADQTVIIGAHYDHLGYGKFGSLYIGDTLMIHNGADDNASGVAGLLYLADVCSGKFNNYNFLFIAFSGEERGLLGSNYYVKNPTINLSTVNYMINMDMIGRLKPEKSLAVNGVGTSPQWAPALEKIGEANLHIVTSESGVGPSDHTSFYYEGIPVLHFFTGQHEDYHKPTDDIERVNFEGMYTVLTFITALISDLDDDPRLTFTETQDSSQVGRSDFKVTLGVMPDYLFDGTGMRIDGVRPNRPADNAGLIKGDIVIKMGELNVQDMMGYMEALQSFTPGQTIKVVIERDGKEIEKELTFD